MRNAQNIPYPWRFANHPAVVLGLLVSDVQVILNSFLREELDFQQLQRELSGALKTDPEARWQALGMLRELRGSNRISQRLHEILKTEIQHGLLDVVEDDTQVINDETTQARSRSNGNGSVVNHPLEAEIKFDPDPKDEEEDADNTRAVVHGAKKDKPAADPDAVRAGGVKQKKPLGVGSVLNGRFVLESRLGRGGMGVVYKALDQRRKGADHSPYVALKVLREDFKTHPESLNALQRESHEAQRLSHPNIVNVFDFDRDGETYFMTMELLQGEPLSNLFSRQQRQPLPKEEAFRIIRGLGQGLMFAHDHNVVHLDFKPGNVFLTESGGVKILDFGIAQVTNAPGQTEFTLGISDSNSLNAMTPAYASCERLEGAGPDPRDDVYALACVAYELLAGCHPFSKKSALDARKEKLTPQRIKELSRKQWRAMVNGLALERSQRTMTVGHFLDQMGVLPADVSPYLSADTGPRTKTHGEAPAQGTHWGIGVAVALTMLASLAYFGYDEIGQMIRGDYELQRFSLRDDPAKNSVVPPTLDSASEQQEGLAEVAATPETEESGVFGDEVAAAEGVNVESIPEESLVPSDISTQANVEPALSSAGSDETETGPMQTTSPPVSQDEEVVLTDPAEIPDVVVDTSVQVSSSVPDLPGSFAFAEDTMTVREGASAVLIKIVRTGGSKGSASVAWGTNSVTAEADTDYGHFAESTETFSDGQSESSIFIPVVSDAEVESNESFFVSLFQPSEGAKLGLTTQVLVTILDDD